ncbi:MAG: poly-gamma-glutamate system protein [Spirochaetales bacterium]
MRRPVRPPSLFDRLLGRIKSRGIPKGQRASLANPGIHDRKLLLQIAALGLGCLAAVGAATLQLPGEGGLSVPPAIEAAAANAEKEMGEAETFLRNEKIASGIPVEAFSRGLIGDEYNEITTTLGSLSAKRTAENPLWASALVRRLWSAGLREGDFVAAGMSGSFPGLNLALAVACKNLGLRLVAISSVTASTHGANQPGFTWPEMEGILIAQGYIDAVSKGIAAGGAGDLAADLQPEGQALAKAIAKRSAATLGARLLVPENESDAVAKRVSLYRDIAKGVRIALYVNVGGTEASLGSSAAVLELSSGFLPAIPFDLSEKRGVMAMMMESGVPVLSLLNIRDLALKWGVPIEE